jgi:hypothetical protein
VVHPGPERDVITEHLRQLERLTRADGGEHRHPVGLAPLSLVETERVLASVTEAVIGACYLHNGYETTAAAVVEAFQPEIEQALNHPVDFKSTLQERLAQRGEVVAYDVTAEHGPPHARIFEVLATVEEREVGRGTGRSKKAAEQEAAVIRASIRNARTRFANGKHQAAFQLLEKLDAVAHPIVEETLKELRAAYHEIEERRRVEQERLERERQLATLIGTARAAIKAARFTDALEALSTVRSIDSSVSGLEELTEQARRGQAGESATARGLDDDRLASDEDATRVILIDAKGTPREAEDKARSRPTSSRKRDAGERDGGDEDGAGTGTWNPEAVQRKESRNRTWLWVVAAVVGILVLLLLGALYRYTPATSRVGARPAVHSRTFALARMDGSRPRVFEG